AISPEGGLKTGTVNCTGQVIGIAGSGERKFAYTTDGTAPVLGASNTKEVKYTWNSTTQSGKIDDFSSTHSTVVANGGYVTVIAQAIKDGALTGAIDTVTYRFKDYVPLAVKLTPPTATVPYGTSLTPKAEVINTTDATRSFAFTIDGTNPVINTKDASAGNESTWVVTYTYDPVIPTSDLGTFYMTPGNVLAFIDRNGRGPIQLTGATVTVKVQAIGEALASISTDPVKGTNNYYLEGNIATGVYTFEPAGAVPGKNYTLTVTNKEAVSVNKVVADVVVTNNETGKDDGVEVYYTTDGSELGKKASPLSFHLVRNRKITIYAKPGEVSKSGTIKVFIVNSDMSITKDSCNYDLTYSTSEGGYLNYQNNSTGNTIGGDGHIVVYVQPYVSDGQNDRYNANYVMLYAYEKLTDGSHASLILPYTFITNDDTTTVKGEKWYYFDLEPVKNYKEVSVLLGYMDIFTDATVANACKDMFLKYDMATGQITDVTHAYTGDHFYTTGTTGTKTEAANPSSTEAFIYVQVPAAWVTKGNSVKVLNGTAEVGSVAVQGAAETSDLSRVCKITGLTSITDGTQLTIKPYKGSTAGSVSFTISYKNGGYYYYESASHYSTTAPLVFSADTDNNKDYRSKGRRDINHVTKGDKTNYLANSWAYSTEPESKTASITDNWNGAASATVNVIPSGTTISQEVTGLTASTPYTVQMIVRGKSGAKGTMTLKGATTTTDELNLTGYDAQGVITSDGRVEYLLNNNTTKNGWQKLEATANASAEGKLTISLAAVGKEMQLSDVTLLENANTAGHVWTTAPTSNETTEYDLSDRATANAFSFFDRGDNKNAIVYANANTVLGMSSNTYDVAVAIPTTSSAKAILRASSESEAGDSGSETSSVTPKYSMHTFAITDQAQDGTRNTDGSGSAAFWVGAWKYNVSKPFTAKNFGIDRHFTQGKRSTICVPVALSASEIASIFGNGTKVYDLKSVDVSKYEINATDVTDMEANHPYIIFVPNDYDYATVAGTFSVAATGSEEPKVALDGGYTFYSNYEQKTIYYSDTEKCYNFGDAEGGRFYRVNSRAQGVPAKPFRGYIKADSPKSSAKMFTLRIVDNTTTGVDSITTTEGMTDGPVYTLTGIRVAEKLNSSLAPGIYIQNGKKIIVK
ncbi:MAG: chitobiase/beta-hexosaminidase C-terminal domain-containing protein, partial [Prevotella sp.]|nr:chitobiase/beta-hexosaminidase C-terminal domain-containing protein [Prevotella sp.]